MKIALVAPVIIKNDAVSNGVRDKYHALKNLDYISEIKIYCFGCEYDWPEVIRVNKSVELLYHDFLSKDIYIFEWAIYNNLIPFLRLIDTNISNNNIQHKPKIVIHFHNVTSPELVDASQRELMQKSYEQFVLFNCAHKVWSTSEFNKQELIDWGVKEEKISLLPPAIQFRDINPPTISQLMQYKKNVTIHLLYVGRFVPSKGLVDLIEAMRIIVKKGVRNIKLNLAGGLTFSDNHYLEKIKELIASYELNEYIDIILDADEDQLRDLYKLSHIFVTPSLHEGFCVPIVEAVHYGCYVIAYHNSNLPYIIKHFGITVENKNKNLLAKTLFMAVQVFSQSKNLKTIPIELLGKFISYEDFLQQATDYANSFNFLNYQAQLQTLLLELQNRPLPIDYLINL